MKAQWFPTPISPPPAGEPLNDFIKVDFRLALQIHECPEDSDGCDWFDTDAVIHIHTDGLQEAGTELPGQGGTFEINDDLFGDFTGRMDLIVVTERVER